MIAREGVEQIPATANIGYDDPRTYLPAEIVEVLDTAFGSVTETPVDVVTKASAASKVTALVTALNEIGRVLPHNLLSTATTAQHRNTCMLILNAWNTYAVPALEAVDGGAA